MSVVLLFMQGQKALRFNQKYLLTGLEQHEGVYFCLNYPFNQDEVSSIWRVMCNDLKFYCTTDMTRFFVLCEFT